VHDPRVNRLASAVAQRLGAPAQQTRARRISSVEAVASAVVSRLSASRCTCGREQALEIDLSALRQTYHVTNSWVIRRW
jgi:hypothetical protein